MYRITKKELVEAITIPVLNISSLTLYHKVRLAKPDKNGNRDYFHKEYSYTSKYKEPKCVSTLRLTHSSILTIEPRDENATYQDSLIININSRDFIVKCFKLFRKNILKKEDLVIAVKDEEKINPNYRRGLSFEPYADKVILLQPILVETDSGNNVCVRMYMNVKKSTAFIDISEEDFSILIKVIKKFDFHIAGLVAVTYLQSSDIGERVIHMDKVDIRNFEDYEPVNKVKIDPDMNKLKTVNHSPTRGW